MTSSVLENPATTKYVLIPFQCNKINNKDTKTYMPALHTVHSASHLSGTPDGKWPDVYTCALMCASSRRVCGGSG